MAQRAFAKKKKGFSRFLLRRPTEETPLNGALFLSSRTKVCMGYGLSVLFPLFHISKDSLQSRNAYPLIPTGGPKIFGTLARHPRCRLGWTSGVRPMCAARDLSLSQPTASPLSARVKTSFFLFPQRNPAGIS